MSDHQIRDEDELSGFPLKDLSIGGPEFVCAECRARCTESPTSEAEYGHRGWCSHSLGVISREESDKRAQRRRQNAEEAHP